jgi:hypothetical protein
MSFAEPIEDMKRRVSLEVELVREHAARIRLMRRTELIDDVEVRRHPSCGLVGFDEHEVELALDLHTVVANAAAGLRIDRWAAKNTLSMRVALIPFAANGLATAA